MAASQTNDSIILLVAIIGASATIITAGIGTWSLFRNNRLSRTNDHRLAVLKILLEAAYKEYEFRTKQDIEIATREGTIPKIKSFTEYIIFYKELSYLFTRDSVTEIDIEDALSKNKDLIDAYYAKRDRFQPEYHKTNT